VVPGMLGLGKAQERMSDVLLLPLVVSVQDAELHRSHFMVRGAEDVRKESACPLSAGVRRDQEDPGFILERAAKEGTLVVENVSIDDAVGAVVDALYGIIEQTEVQAGER